MAHWSTLASNFPNVQPRPDQLMPKSLRLSTAKSAATAASHSCRGDVLDAGWPLRDLSPGVASVESSSGADSMDSIARDGDAGPTSHARKAAAAAFTPGARCAIVFLVAKMLFQFSCLVERPRSSKVVAAKRPGATPMRCALPVSAVAVSSVESSHFVALACRFLKLLQAPTTFSSRGRMGT